MLCKTCGFELPEAAKFCPNCSTPVPKPVGVHVEQKVDNVKGDVAGLLAGAGAMPSGLNASVTQDVGTVESGGTVTGAILGSEDSHIHVGGTETHETVYNNPQTVDTGGGAYIGGNLTTGGDFTGRDRISITGSGNVKGVSTNFTH